MVSRQDCLVRPRIDIALAEMRRWDCTIIQCRKGELRVNRRHIDAAWTGTSYIMKRKMCHSSLFLFVADARRGGHLLETEESPYRHLRYVGDGGEGGTVDICATASSLGMAATLWKRRQGDFSAIQYNMPRFPSVLVFG